MDGAVVLVAVLSHIAILATAYSLARSSNYLAPRAGGVVATAVLMPWFTLIEPARETINYGQINLVLMALVAADFLLPRTRWPRGLLVGIAAAIKLTPLGFLLLFLPRRDYRADGRDGPDVRRHRADRAGRRAKDSADWWLDKMLSTWAGAAGVADLLVARTTGSAPGRRLRCCSRCLCGTAGTACCLPSGCAR
ncbi:glycosyltransferase family 87 protein [Saccharopolyspora sp. NPDC000995]